MFLRKRHERYFGMEVRLTEAFGQDAQGLFCPSDIGIAQVFERARKRGLSRTVSLATLEFSRERLKSAGLVVGVQFLVGLPDELIQFLGRGAVFVRGVILRINLDGAKGDNRAINHHADVFALQGLFQPGPKVLTGGGDGQCFQKVILMSFNVSSTGLWQGFVDRSLGEERRLWGPLTQNNGRISSFSIDVVGINGILALHETKTIHNRPGERACAAFCFASG